MGSVWEGGAGTRPRCSRRVAGATSPRRRARSPGHDFVGKERVAELRGLSPGDVTVRVRLVDRVGNVVIERRVRVTRVSTIQPFSSRDRFGMVALPGERRHHE